MSTYHVIREMLGHQQSTTEDGVPNSRWMKKVKEWPAGESQIEGQTFSAESEQGKALVGTPHGYSIYLLLLQHWEKLGGKTIDTITVFTSDDWGAISLHMLVKLKKSSKCESADSEEALSKALAET